MILQIKESTSKHPHQSESRQSQDSPRRIPFSQCIHGQKELGSVPLRINFIRSGISSHEVQIPEIGM